MAAMSIVPNFPRRLSCYRLSYSILRCIGTNPSSPYKHEDSAESGIFDPGADLPPKRGPLSVLKALAKTVTPSPLAPPKELYEDKILNPGSPFKMEECKAARLSGFKAAEYILDKYPQLFPMRKPEPAWEASGSISVKTEADLKAIISKRIPREAIDGYEKLVSEGVTVSLETKNELLDLVGFFGTVSTEDLESGSNDSEMSSNDLDESTSLEDSAQSVTNHEDEEDEMTNVTLPNTWRMDNFGEKLFSSMKEKNSKTYDAMILALCKHNNPRRAFEIFQEMREKQFQASVFTYNTLIEKSPHMYGRDDNLWQGVREIIGHMKADPLVTPTHGTYYELLKLCVLLPGRSNLALEIIRDMHHKGIEPSLAAFSLLLRSEYSRDVLELHDKNEKVKEEIDAGILQAVVSHLETYDVIPPIKHPSDVEFFNTAMGSALVCGDSKSAHRLYILAKTNDPVLLGPKRSYFYATFLRCLARFEKNPEIVNHFYKEIVPSKCIPNGNVYTDMFKMIEREKMPRFVPRLYEDMKRLRVPIKEQTATGIFKALSRRTSPKNCEIYIEIMNDVLYWVKTFGIPIKIPMILSLLKQYCIGQRLEEAWEVMKMFEKNDFYPPYSAIISMLGCSTKKRNIEITVKVFELAANYGYSFPKRVLSELCQSVQMPINTRMYIMDLFEDGEELNRRRQMLLKQDNDAEEERKQC